MRWLKYGAASVGLLLLAVLLALLGYLFSLPTVAPQSIMALPQTTAAQGCLAAQPRASYQVRSQTVTKQNGQPLHQLNAEFKLHFEARGDDALALLAEPIRLQENDKAAVTIPKLTFLARAEGEHLLTFLAFNALALPQQHPLQVVGQVLKQLSVGQEGEAYRYAYDPFARIYRYQQGTPWQRTVSVPGQINGAELAPVWQLKQDASCWPLRLTAKELQPLQLNGQDAQLVISIEAERLATQQDLAGLDFSAQANHTQQWQGETVAVARQVKTPATTQEAWDLVKDFAQDKNMQQLLQVSTYWVEQVPAQTLATQLLTPELDTQGRDLLFGLGSLPSAASAQYLLDVLAQLPSTGNYAELQKVRTMVALSGHVKADEQVFARYQTLLQDPNESTNIRHNALINMGRVIQEMSTRGDATSSLTSELRTSVQQGLSSANAASAIFAAGNAGLEQEPRIQQQLRQHLANGTAKDRFASATVLSRHKDNYDLLKAQLSVETSPLVKNAIVEGLSQAGISAAQQQELRQLLGN